MIVCFTGTGNSKAVAIKLHEILGDDIERLPPGLMCSPEKITLHVDDGRVIWVFPTFCWGLPKGVEWVIDNAHFISATPVTHHMVTTCGDDIGLTDRQWRSRMRRRGWTAGSAFSVQMPNSFTFMKGFDVDTPEVVAAKMAAMPQRVRQIAQYISEGKSAVTDVVPGKWAWVKSKVIRPWFNRYIVDTRHFRTTDACNGCGRCARNCPYLNIEIVDKRPVWHKRCTLCTRCYQVCPRHAVQFDHATTGKGQYLCDGYTLIP